VTRWILHTGSDVGVRYILDLTNERVVIMRCVTERDMNVRYTGSYMVSALSFWRTLLDDRSGELRHGKDSGD
jgi:hypothetical protein